MHPMPTRPLLAPSHTLLVACIVTLVLAGTARGQSQPLPPPAARPVTGHVLFSDDFSDSSLARWHADRDGAWRIEHGMLRGELPDARQQHTLIEAGADTWTDIALDVDVYQMRGVDKGVVVRVGNGTGVGIDLRGAPYNDVLLSRGEWPLGKAAVRPTKSGWHHVRLEARGDRVAVWVDGMKRLERRDAARGARAGHIALAAYTGGVAKCLVWYDRVVVTALAPTPAASSMARHRRAGRTP